MQQINIIHITEKGLIDYQYKYNNKIEKALKDIDKIKDKDNFRVSVYDDKECTEYESTVYTLDLFKHLYGANL